MKQIWGSPRLIAIAGALLLAVVSSSCSTLSRQGKPPAPDASVHELQHTGGGTGSLSVPLPEESMQQAGPPAPEPAVTLAAVGDVLLHRSVYEDARTGNSFDFRPMLAPVKSMLETADIAIANQESVTGGAAIGLSDYPAFNSPFEVADALRDAGLDLVTMANNHALDRGERALQRAIAHWRTLGVEYTGASTDEADRRRLRILEKHGLKLAFLAYTYGTNGILSPPGKEYLVHRLDKEALKQEVSQARQSADAVIVSLHFGNEYQRLPNAGQQELVRLAASAGAVLILGHHPHVLQPAEWVDDGHGSRSLAVYSLGNFIAAQKQPGPYTRIGGILQAKLRKKAASGDSPGGVTVEHASIMPTYIRFSDWRGYRVVPLASVEEHELKGASSIRDELRQHMRRWMPELEILDR
ncbi:CapA family protein [Paenibacillus filicis]|uniref:CapA family protein n=1 Tax=Paenibacillus filicis TaxID=669464 RepID=A0ABU9DL88_9BACL